MSTFTPKSVVSGTKEVPVILLLNSMGTTTEMWEPQLPMLENHFRVIRMDHRGHGQSDTPDGDYSFDDLVADAIAVLDEHKVETATVMGCSIGSMTALGLGLAAPDRIDRVVCAAARADAPEMFRQSWDDRAAIINEKGVGALWNGSLGVWFTPAFQEANPDVVAKMHAEFLKTTDQGYIRCGAALKGLDYLKDLPNMKVPTLFIAGAEDKGAPPAVMEQMAEVTPNSLFTVIPDAGHIVNVNAPEAFSLAIMEFLGITCE